MSGPSLLPVASLAPAAPAQGMGGVRADASTADASTADAADPAAQSFAQVLRRQMKGDRSEEASDPPAGASSPLPPDSFIPAFQETVRTITSETAAEAALDASAEQTQQSALSSPPPELAVLVAASLMTTPQPGAPSSPLPPLNTGEKAESPGPQPGILSGHEGILPALSLPPPALQGKGGKFVAEDATHQAANSAAENRDAPPANSQATEETSLPAITPQVATPAAPATAEPSPSASHNFAAVHAAALATLKGESPQTTAPNPVPLHIATPANSPEWPEAVAHKVSWMAGQAESHAELTLTPPQLGKIEVSINLNGEQATAQFLAANPATRELLEQSLPRLREILEQSGINLGQTDVGTPNQSNQPGDSDAGQRRSGIQRGGEDGGMPAAMETPTPWIRRGDGLVDTFA
ncbi:flagellar hook-length control protein FliK [Zoogloea sp.]|uniref:flagellar hook-length control protein FliK n=1 Tax=Zoogloea sp. TaxID=49181 RepID=UPI0026020A21|nr:flagellar hook-length control protein FliK [Zoogloea sp.]MDD3353957.1 flagellar hook-length control protein FliK [Zoogloea sp.]